MTPTLVQPATEPVERLAHAEGARSGRIARIVAHTVARTATGVLAALCVCELGLRALVTPVDVVIPHIDRDSVEARAITVRQIEEGIATAHYSASGARLTGHPWLDSAQTVVLIGDSYVAARELPDQKTIGARLEQLARDASVRVNVRQYGWRGASPARYVESAPMVLARWNPAAVIVPLSNDDLDERATSGDPPFLHIGKDGATTVVTEPRTAFQPPASSSVLVTMVRRRWMQMSARSGFRRGLSRFAARWSPTAAVAASVHDDPNISPRDSIAPAVVRALTAAYGPRLMIVYLADVRATGGATMERGEAQLFASCRDAGVTCLSTRQTMLAARAHDTIARGFTTTTLGVGHLNADGTRLVASELWSALQPRLSAAER